MKGKRLFLLYFFAILLLLNIHFQSEGNEDDLFRKIGIQPIKRNRIAPNFSLKDLNNKKTELKNFKGKLIFLNFWATWCHPCKEEMPSMEALYQQFKEKNFVFLAVSVDYEGMKKVKEYVEKYHFTFPILIDSKSEVFALYGAKRIPTTFIIDKKGKMIGKVTGPRYWNSQEVISLLHQLTPK